MKKIFYIIIIFYSINKPIYGQFNYDQNSTQSRILINFDLTKSEIRSSRVKLSFEVNKDEEYAINGTLKVEFGIDKENLILMKYC